MAKTISLDELSRMQFEEDRSRSELAQRDLEGSFWEAWRWRRRIQPSGFPHLAQIRKSVVLCHMDALFRYVEFQRSVIHQLIGVVGGVLGKKSGKAKICNLYAEMLGIASRYDLEGRLIVPVKGKRGGGNDEGHVHEGAGGPIQGERRRGNGRPAGEDRGGKDPETA